MSIESRLALKILVLTIALAMAFAFGAWFGAKDRTCITGQAAVGTVVVCRSGHAPIGVQESV